MNDIEGRPKTSRDFFRDLEKAASISPNTKEQEYLAKKAADDQDAQDTDDNTATFQNRREQKSFYTGSRSKKNLAMKKALKKKHPWSLKKASPLVAIISGISACLFVIFGSTSLLGAHLEALYTEATDTQYTSSTLRSVRLFSYMLNGGNQLSTTWAGTRKYKTFSPWLKTRLEKNGITVKNGALEFKGQTISADNFSTAYRDNVEFRNAYSTAKRGRVAGFFDDAAERIYRKLGLSRNVMEDFKQTGDADADDANYRQIMSEQFENDDLDASTKTINEETVTDENGNPKVDENGKPITQKSEAADSGKPSSTAGESSTAKAHAYLSKATAAVSTACGALKIGSLLATTVSAVETYSAIHYFMNITENYSKYKYGEGSAAAVNQANNFFTRSVTTEYPDPETGEMTTISGAPLEGENERVILGGVKPNLEKANKYSFSRLSKVLKTTLGTYGATAVACATANAANAALSLATLAIPGSGFIKLTTSLLLDTAVKIGAQIAITATLSFLVPTIARTLFENHFESLAGIPAGEAYGKGAAAANTQLAARGSGQTGASAEKIAQYSRDTAEVLALDAEVDRHTHSPFDATNKNTFLGSIVSSALSFATTSSLFGPLSTIGNLASSSLASLTGSAYADSGLKYFDFYGDCSDLDDIGGVKGDIYCNRITITDPSTKDLSPDDETYQSVLSPNLEIDENGHEKIKDGSRLSKFINFCTERDSPWGVYDASIAAAFETSLGPLDALPYLGDGIAIINAIENLDPEIELWARGTICNATSENPYWETEMKYYQRYLEDNRILGQLGAFESEDLDDPVLAYKKYYEELHPVDNSKEGFLARITGSTKDDIETMLAVIDYYNFLENYHPEERYAFNNETTEVQIAAPFDLGNARGRNTPWEGERLAGPIVKSVATVIVKNAEITA